MSEHEERREADLLLEVGHPSRPDREELMRQHIARMKARAWDEGYLRAIEPESDIRDNPYAATSAGVGTEAGDE